MVVPFPYLQCSAVHSRKLKFIIQRGETEKDEEGNLDSLLGLEEDEVKKEQKAIKCSEVTAEEQASIRKEVRQIWGQVVNDIVKKTVTNDESKNQQGLDRDGFKMDNDQAACFRKLQDKNNSLASDEHQKAKSDNLEVGKEAKLDTSSSPVTEARNALKTLRTNKENHSEQAVKSRRKKTIDIEESEEPVLVKKCVLVKSETIGKNPIGIKFTSEPPELGERSRVAVEKAFLVNHQKENTAPPVEYQQQDIFNSQRMTRSQLLKLREIDFGMMRER